MAITPKGIRIFQNSNHTFITMQDVLDGNISKCDVYKRQVNEWYFNPIKELSKKTDSVNFGISMFMLEISFFESHAQYFKGMSSERKPGQNNQDIGSAKFFNDSLEEFLNYLKSNNRFDFEVEDMIKNNPYSKIRCGLFHNGYLAEGFLVDSTDQQKKSFYKDLSNIGYDGWIANPWELIIDMESYFNHYLDLIKNNEKIAEKFNDMFEEFFFKELKAQGIIAKDSSKLF